MNSCPPWRLSFCWCRAARLPRHQKSILLASVVETVRQRAEIYKVGPYYVGPVDPQFNADGTLFGVEPEPEPEPEEPAAPEEE
jgi:hypothetical protein